ncbi:hypothetical protein K438DRAFT_1759066 [Mycena galopus ATCC 62051]|nr:hypothetical protein K438DRAFT_1759066 [Mycena galopus ATCC 62051]
MATCDNPACATPSAPALLVCTEAALPSNIVLEAADEDEDEDDDEDDDDAFCDPCSALKSLQILVEHVEGGRTVRVGSIDVQKIDKWHMAKAPEGFYDCLEEYSEELAALAAHFNKNGVLLNVPGWSSQAFWEDRWLVFLGNTSINRDWNAKGLGAWLLPRIFRLGDLGVQGECDHIVALPPAELVATFKEVDAMQMIGRYVATNDDASSTIKLRVENEYIILSTKRGRSTDI